MDTVEVRSSMGRLSHVTGLPASTGKSL